MKLIKPVKGEICRINRHFNTKVRILSHLSEKKIDTTYLKI